MNVTFYLNQNGRARHVCDAVVAGCRRHGVEVRVRSVTEYRRPEADVALFYGLWPPLKQLRQDYAAAGRKAVLIDLGYWGRIEGGKLAGFHRFSVNGLHATAYFQRVKHGPERFQRFGVELKPFSHRGEHILLCGMSEKAAWVYGLAPEQWERQAVEKLRLHMRVQRPIHYRPKQSWKHATHIPGTTWAPSDAPIQRALENCWAVVTHHGNSALDALGHGVPVFTTAGLASVLASADVAAIDAPRYPSEEQRNQLLYDAAWTQWKMSEIAAGEAWQYLLDEKLIEP